MNTKIEYMYRDAENYKEYETVIIPGEITKEQKELIKNNLDDNENFIPSQVGLEDLQPRMINFPSESDHIWHEFDISENDLLTDEPPTTNHCFKDISEFVEQFKDIEWDILEAMKNLSIE